MGNNILSTYIAAYDEHNMITAPPERMLEIMVIAGVATLRIRPGEWQSTPHDPAEPDFSIDVPAHALLLALTAQVQEDATPDPDLYPLSKEPGR